MTYEQNFWLVQEKKVAAVTQLNVISLLADVAVSLKKSDAVELILPLFVGSLEEGDASIPSPVRLQVNFVVIHLIPFMHSVRLNGQIVSTFYKQHQMNHACCVTGPECLGTYGMHGLPQILQGDRCAAHRELREQAFHGRIHI